MTIQWENPPPVGTGRRPGNDYAAMAAALRSKPGQWAKIHTGHPSVAQAIKRGGNTAFLPPGAFEAVSRNYRREDGKPQSDIYARYIGDAPHTDDKETP